jgi:N-acyl homoserine lactone hydrolase
MKKIGKRNTLKKTYLVIFLTGIVSLNILGCKNTAHEVAVSKLGHPVSARTMESILDQPGPITMRSITSANWHINRGDIINLDSPTAKTARLLDGSEKIQIYAHVLRHPTRGYFLIDTGVSKRFVADPSSLGVSWFVQKVIPIKEMEVIEGTADALKQENASLSGVLLTHLHIDHISGLPDIPSDVPLYVGSNEASDEEWKYAATQSTVNSLLKDRLPLQELKFTTDPDGKFAGILDLFGDASVFAILSPGHTSGSMAFIVRTTTGPVLLTGDTCHSRWGWDNSVEPGAFISKDQVTNLRSLMALKSLISRHPTITVKLGHQQ